MNRGLGLNIIRSAAVVGLVITIYSFVAEYNSGLIHAGKKSEENIGTGAKRKIGSTDPDRNEILQKSGASLPPLKRSDIEGFSK